MSHWRAITSVTLLPLAAAAACRPVPDFIAREQLVERCAYGDPPADVAAWVDESWAGSLSTNVTTREGWLLDALVKGDGVLNVCVRWGATTPFTAAARDQIEGSMRTWLEGWLRYLEGDTCYPFPQGVTVKLAGIAVKPGRESLLGWSDRTIPVYTETDPGTTPAGEPRCPDACSFFRHWDHRFPECPGGEAAHFDYELWLDDALPDGNLGSGGDWGLRVPERVFTRALGGSSSRVLQQVIGYGFGFQSYDGWTGSFPPGGSLMTGDAAAPPNASDGWLLRRLWQEQKSMRGW